MITTRDRATSSTEAAAGLAVIVHAAGALYLGISGRDLREVVAVGFSLADVAELRGRSLAGLAQAIADALRRTGSRAALAPAAVNRVLAVEEEGWDAWQEVVDEVIAEPDGREHDPYGTGDTSSSPRRAGDARCRPVSTVAGPPPERRTRPTTWATTPTAV